VIVGGVYAVSLMPIVFFVRLSQKNSVEKYLPVLIVAYSIFTFYYIRPLFLLSYPDTKISSIVYSISVQEHISALIVVGVYAFFLLLSIYMVQRMIGDDKYLNEKKYRYMHLHERLVLLLLVIITVVWFMIVVIFDLSSRSTAVDYLQYLFPVSLILPAIFSYIVLCNKISCVRSIKYLFVFLLLLFVVASIYRGSKSAIFVILMLWVMSIYMAFGDRNIKILTFAKYLFLIIPAVFISVVVATTITYLGPDGIMSYGEVFSGQNGIIRLILDKLTGRFNGYDGVLLVMQYNSEMLSNVMNWKDMFLSGLYRVIPGISHDVMSVGKVVGIEYFNKTIFDKHAGALGVFGSFIYMHGIYFGVFVVFVYGYIFSSVAYLAHALHSGMYVRNIFLMITMALFVFSINDGNFDIIFAQGFVQYITFFYYYMLVYIVTKSASSRNNRMMHI